MFISNTINILVRYTSIAFAKQQWKCIIPLSQQEHCNRLPTAVLWADERAAIGNRLQCSRKAIKRYCSKYPAVPVSRHGTAGSLLKL